MAQVKLSGLPERLPPPGPMTRLALDFHQKLERGSGHRGVDGVDMGMIHGDMRDEILWDSDGYWIG
jgi:hypothetical protein